MKKKDYKTPSTMIMNMHIESEIMSTSSTSNINNATTPDPYPDLVVDGETNTADSRRKSLWDDPEEEEDLY